ncbi:hypothetical protein SAMN05444166_7289 [Singulisphaera sp. GP187]|uniref:hypothetical protein n=1 Tax=Singulisphaera sp. GP187 TaxID=1882752 RepID=UPI0009268617|nr:hypothetical protein [Singulisphaera sp. GP187]SIO63245.1 hypothetical protein SAMN05444166_7289 [Singulisphaera sp. GP187]
MLRANVGISRKMSKDYNSRGFTLNLEGEIHATIDDPESVIERIKELYNLAEEALDRQISESREIDAFARRDADAQPDHGNNGKSNGRHQNDSDENPSSNGHRNGSPQRGEPASNKQVQYLTTLAKREKLFGTKLELFIEDAIGRRCSSYDLTKAEAGRIIDQLSGNGAVNDRNRH